MAKVFREVGLQKIKVVGWQNIKEKIRYMRIKLAKRAHVRKAKIAPAKWQEFIEI